LGKEAVVMPCDGDVRELDGREREIIVGFQESFIVDCLTGFSFMFAPNDVRGQCAECSCDIWTLLQRCIRKISAVGRHERLELGKRGSQHLHTCFVGNLQEPKDEDETLFHTE
jgi:hypothetical protein